MKKPLTTAEVAALCGVSNMSIVRWCEEGKGPPCYRTPGNQRRFEPAKLREWMKGRGMPIPDTLEQQAAG